MSTKQYHSDWVVDELLRKHDKDFNEAVWNCVSREIIVEMILYVSPQKLLPYNEQLGRTVIVNDKVQSAVWMSSKEAKAWKSLLDKDEEDKLRRYWDDIDFVDNPYWDSRPH